MAVWILYRENNKGVLVSTKGYEKYEQANRDMNIMVDNGMKRINDYMVYDEETGTTYNLKLVDIEREK